MGDDVLDKVSQIGLDFLNELDEYLATNLNELTCKDIYNIYASFFDNLKKSAGSSHGFTGLSEYIIFRFLLHQLGGLSYFQTKDYTNDMKQFVGEKLKIRHNARTPKGNCRPDILILDNNDLVLGCVEIKLYLSNGLATIEKVLKDFENMRKKYPDFKALLIIYNLSKNSIHRESLKRFKSNNKLFDYLILEEDNEIFSERLKKLLCLDSLIK